jgi:precorrin-2/cobalt-factor-2 C20-methyltransferase
MTFKAAETLQSCTKVFVPGEMAAELARPYCDPEILEFPMIEDMEQLKRIWDSNADLVAAFAAEDNTGFATIGDVNTFSTFSHLKRAVLQKNPQIAVETVPGVGVVPSLAAKFGEALDRSFQVSDGTPIDAVIRMKATRPKKMAKELKELGFEEFILGSRLYTPQERILRGGPEKMPEKSDYFSVLLARRRR